MLAAYVRVALDAEAVVRVRRLAVGVGAVERLFVLKHSFHIRHMICSEEWILRKILLVQQSPLLLRNWVLPLTHNSNQNQQQILNEKWLITYWTNVRSVILNLKKHI